MKIYNDGLFDDYSAGKLTGASDELRTLMKKTIAATEHDIKKYEGKYPYYGEMASKESLETLFIEAGLVHKDRYWKEEQEVIFQSVVVAVNMRLRGYRYRYPLKATKVIEGLYELDSEEQTLDLYTSLIENAEALNLLFKLLFEKLRPNYNLNTIYDDHDYHSRSDWREDRDSETEATTKNVGEADYTGNVHGTSSSDAKSTSDTASLGEHSTTSVGHDEGKSSSTTDSTKSGENTSDGTTHHEGTTTGESKSTGKTTSKSDSTTDSTKSGENTSDGTTHNDGTTTSESTTVGKTTSKSDSTGTTSGTTHNEGQSDESSKTSGKGNNKEASISITNKFPEQASGLIGRTGAPQPGDLGTTYLDTGAENSKNTDNVTSGESSGKSTSSSDGKTTGESKNNTTGSGTSDSTTTATGTSQDDGTSHNEGTFSETGQSTTKATGSGTSDDETTTSGTSQDDGTSHNEGTFSETGHSTTIGTTESDSTSDVDGTTKGDVNQVGTQHSEGEHNTDSVNNTKSTSDTDYQTGTTQYNYGGRSSDNSGRKVAKAELENIALIEADKERLVREIVHTMRSKLVLVAAIEYERPFPWIY